MELDVFHRRSYTRYPMDPDLNLESFEERKVKMLWMRLWCGNGDNVWQWHMAHVHCTLQSESDPLCCNYDFSSFTFLFCVSFPSAAMANPSHIAHRTNTLQKMDCFQCCEPFGIARTANLLLLVCDAPITSNTPDINCTHTHTFGQNTKWNFILDSLVCSIN